MIDPRAIIGDAPEHRDYYATPGPTFPPTIAREARINALVTVDSGLKRSTTVGASLVMKHAHIGHDAIVGDGCEIAPGAVVCGECEIGDGVRIGVNASILPGRKVGEGARIGAGAVVTHDVPAGEVWAGNPARCLF